MPPPPATLAMLQLALTLTKFESSHESSHECLTSSGQKQAKAGKE